MAERRLFNTRAMSATATITCLCIFQSHTTSHATDNAIFDELRFGVSTSIASDTNGEDGVFPSFTAYFDPFSSNLATGFDEKFLRPRLHIGTEIGTSGSPHTIYGGVNWTIDLTQKAFLDLGFGGLWHDGDLRDDGTQGAKMGCRALFREYAALGYRFDQHWSLMAQISHASHADLCDGPNDGLTRAGLMVGYKF